MSGVVVGDGVGSRTRGDTRSGVGLGDTAEAIASAIGIGVASGKRAASPPHDASSDTASPIAMA